MRERESETNTCLSRQKMILVAAPASDANQCVIRSKVMTKAQVCNWVFSGMVADAVDPWIIVSVI